MHNTLLKYCPVHDVKVGDTRNIKCGRGEVVQEFAMYSRIENVEAQFARYCVDMDQRNPTMYVQFICGIGGCFPFRLTAVGLFEERLMAPHLLRSKHDESCANDKCTQATATTL